MQKGVVLNLKSGFILGSIYVHQKFLLDCLNKIHFIFTHYFGHE